MRVRGYAWVCLPVCRETHRMTPLPQPVLYGQPFQLLHIKSGKLLRFNSKVVPDTEPNASTVTVGTELGG